MGKQKDWAAMLTTAAQAEAFLWRQLETGQIPDESILEDLKHLAEALGSGVGVPAPLIEGLQGNAGLQYWLSALSVWRETVGEKIAEPVPEPAAPPVIQNNADKRFYDLMDRIEKQDVPKIVAEMKRAYRALSPSDQKLAADYYAKYPYWGSLNPKQGDYSVMENRANTLKNQREDFLWLYGRLCDYRSKLTLSAILVNWYSFDLVELNATKEKLYGDYFDFDIFPCGRQEVFVDLGAYIGDTAVEYMKRYGGCKKMYCYEITRDSFTRLKKITAAFRMVECRRRGVSDHSGVMYISRNTNSGSANRLTKEADGKEAIEVVTLDEDIQEPVTFIKMDIEGSEQAALRGAAGHIRATHPKLAICTYHNNEDIWKIPRMIDEIEPGYRFYMRHNGGNLCPSEYVLLAI